MSGEVYHALDVVMTIEEIVNFLAVSKVKLLELRFLAGY